MADENKLILDVDVKPLKTQLKEASIEVQRARQNFGEFSDEAIAAAQKVAAIKDEIEAAAESAQLFDPGKRFQALGTAAQTAVGGIAAVQGAMALFGTQSEDLAKSLQKVQGALALSQGLSQLKDVGKVGEQLKITFKGVTAGMSTFKKALVSTGVGALVAALGLLIANFDDVKKYVLNLFPALGKLADFIGGVVNSITDFIGVTSEAERQLDKFAKTNARVSEGIDAQIKLLTAQGGKEKEIYQLKQKQNENELNVLRQTLKVKGELSDEELKKFRELKNDKLVTEIEYNKQVEEKEKAAAEKRKAEGEKQREKDKAKKEKELAEKEKQDAKVKEADTILAEAKISLENKLAQDKFKVEEDYKAKVEKLKEAGVTDTEKYALLERAKKNEIRLLEEADEKEKAAKQLEYDNQINSIRNNTKLLAIKDSAEKEREALFQNYQQQYADIDTNEKYTAEQKLALKKALQEQEAAELEILNDGIRQKQIEKDITEIDYQISQAEFQYNIQRDLVDKKKALYKEQFDAGIITQDQYTAYLRKNAEEQDNIDKAVVQNKLQTAGQVAGILNSMADLVGKDTAKGKALGIASATINTFVGATQALGGKVPAPEPFATIIRIAQAGVIVASGIKSIKEIAKAKVPSGGGGGSVPSPSVSAPSISNQLPTLGTSPLTSIEKMFDNQKPLKAYVVESEVTGTQKRVSDIERRAGF